MVDYIEVEGNKNLAREVSSNAIINRNRGAYELAKKRAADAQRQRDEIRNTTRDINTLKDLNYVREIFRKNYEIL